MTFLQAWLVESDYGYGPSCSTSYHTVYSTVYDTFFEKRCSKVVMVMTNGSDFDRDDSEKRCSPLEISSWFDWKFSNLPIHFWEHNCNSYPLHLRSDGDGDYTLMTSAINITILFKVWNLKVSDRQCKTVYDTSYEGHVETQCKPGYASKCKTVYKTGYKKYPLSPSNFQKVSPSPLP